MTKVVRHMGWFDLGLGCSTNLLSYPAILPNPHLPRQKLADSGRTEIIVNPSHVPDHFCHPVLCIYCTYCTFRCKMCMQIIEDP